MDHESHHPHGSGEVSHLKGLEGVFDTYLHLKAPFQLPVKAKEFFVQYGPWISLVIIIIAAVALVPLLLLAFGITLITLPVQAVAGSLGTTTMGWVGIFISLASLILNAMAIPGLLKRKLSGWHLVYYASLISAISSVVSGHIVSAIIGLIISMYILFQIRSYYK